LNNGSSSNSPLIPVGAFYPDGTTLQDAISGSTYSVSGGNVSLTLNALKGVLLLPAPVSVDLTPPTAAFSLSPAVNSSGWHNTSPASVHISGNDSGSGVSQILYWLDGGPVTSTAGSTAVASVSAAGTHTLRVRVLDHAGNISQQYTQAVNIDLTPPVVTITGVSNGATYSYGSVPVADCSTTDALSGVASSATLALSATNGSGSATYTATCSGSTDDAGNAAQAVTATYTVTVSGNAPASGTALTAASQVTSNTVGNNLSCQDNTSITHGGNTAKQKQGHCTAF
jgi:hypothetical protein